MKDKIFSLLKRFGKAFWGSLSHNLGLKLLALLLAILLWSYVVSSNPSITRTKDINGLTAYLSNESTLNANRLALANDPAEALDGISVRLEVPQSSYALADADNVQVTLDLSSVRAAGTQEVPLRATTSYGRVVRIVPDSIKLEFETYDSRSVPVNAAVSGEQREDMWYLSLIHIYAGATAGAMLTGEDENVRRYLGLALVPQAGVSIGLAALGERMPVSYTHLFPALSSWATTLRTRATTPWPPAGSSSSPAWPWTSPTSAPCRWRKWCAKPAKTALPAPRTLPTSRAVWWKF